MPGDRALLGRSWWGATALGALQEARWESRRAIRLSERPAVGARGRSLEPGARKEGTAPRQDVRIQKERQGGDGDERSSRHTASLLLAGLVCPAGNRKGMRGTQEQSKRKTNNHLAMEIWKLSTERCSWKPRDCQREGLEASQREEARAPPWEAPCCLRSGQGHGQPWPTLSTHPTFAFEKHKQTLGTRVFATQHTTPSGFKHSPWAALPPGRESQEIPGK